MRTRNETRATPLLVSLLLSSTATNAGAQSQEPPTFDTTITVVSVPVFVTDRKGRSVGGLTRDDFQVFDDGKPVRIVSFRSIDTDDPVLVTDRFAANKAALRDMGCENRQVFGR